MRTRIKICGLTSPEEAALLPPDRVDYAGMVLFCPKSRRNITIEKAREIMKALPPEIKKTAVTVSPTSEQVKLIEEAGLMCCRFMDIWQKIFLQKRVFPSSAL